MVKDWRSRKFFVFGRSKVIHLLFFSLFFSFSPSFSVFPGSFDRDPILETQTRGVPATEETIKNSKKGAPAPTFKIQRNAIGFMLEDPVEKVVENKEAGEPAEKITEKKKAEEPILEESEEEDQWQEVSEDSFEKFPQIPK